RWLPAPVTAELSRRARIPGPSGSDGWPPAEPGHPPAATPAPESGMPTLTAARQDPGRDAPSPASPPPPAPGGRRPARLALLLAGIGAVAVAGPAAGIPLPRSHPASSPRTGSPAAASAARQSRAPATAGSRRPTPSGTPPAAPAHVVATALN